MDYLLDKTIPLHNFYDTLYKILLPVTSLFFIKIRITNIKYSLACADILKGLFNFSIICFIFSFRCLSVIPNPFVVSKVFSTTLFITYLLEPFDSLVSILDIMNIIMPILLQESKKWSFSYSSFLINSFLNFTIFHIFNKKI